MTDLEAKKQTLEKQTADLKTDNEALQNTSASTTNLSPEQYLELLSEEKDLN